MRKYVSSAIYIHTPETEHLVERLRQHSSKPSILPVSVDTFISDRQDLMTDLDHVIVSGSLSAIRQVIQLSADHGFSVGVIPTDTQTGKIAEEQVEIDNLPKGKELKKAWKREKIPFFSYASEKRFHDLFSALREDSRINGLYLVLVVLSTILAASGLYLDSASVIIGAMLLAPLMAPIISLAMGLLRGEESRIYRQC